MKSGIKYKTLYRQVYLIVVELFPEYGGLRNTFRLSKTKREANENCKVSIDILLNSRAEYTVF